MLRESTNPTFDLASEPSAVQIGSTIHAIYRVTSTQEIYHKSCTNGAMTNWGASTRVKLDGADLTANSPNVFTDESGGIWMTYGVPVDANSPWSTSFKLAKLPANANPATGWVSANGGLAIWSTDRTFTRSAIWNAANLSLAVKAGICAGFVECSEDPDLGPQYAPGGGMSQLFWIQGTLANESGGTLALRGVGNVAITGTTRPTIREGGNPSVLYCSDFDAWVVMYGDYYPKIQDPDGLFAHVTGKLRFGMCSRDADAFRGENWMRSERTFHLINLSKQFGDPFIFFPTGKDSPCLALYNYDQSTGGQAYLDYSSIGELVKYYFDCEVAGQTEAGNYLLARREMHRDYADRRSYNEFEEQGSWFNGRASLTLAFGYDRKRHGLLGFANAVGTAGEIFIGGIDATTPIRFQNPLHTSNLHIQGDAYGNGSIHIYEQGNATSTDVICQIAAPNTRGPAIFRELVDKFSHSFADSSFIIGSAGSTTGATFADLAGGAGGILAMTTVETEPTTNPPNGVVCWVDLTGNLKCKTKAGNIRTLAAV